MNVLLTLEKNIYILYQLTYKWMVGKGDKMPFTFNDYVL